MTSAYIAILGLYVYLTNIKAQKIDKFILLIYSMVLATFQLEEKQERMRFFQKIFLIANIAIEIILEMFFLIFSKIEINFVDQKLFLKTYILDKALLITKQM